MSTLKYIIGPMRISFLVLPPACVLLGVGSAVWTTGQVNILHAMIALIGAFTAHISVNALNEYYDFKSGLDFMTTRTPFSGGTGTLPAHPEMARSALYTGVITCCITVLIGLFFLYVRGPALLPVGILGILTILAYTTWITHSPLVCLIAPGLGFGPLMVMGTDFVLTGQYSLTGFFASLVPFFLVSDLLLLNQFPDVEPDRRIGRRHYPIIIGNQKSSLIYGAFLLLTYLSILLGVCLGYLPTLSLIGIGTIVLAIPAFYGAFKYSDNIKHLVPYMGINVMINILTPLLVAAGLLLA